MRIGVLGCVVCCLAGSVSYAQVTKTATFENFTAGTVFHPSFTDLMSGMTFRNSTTPPSPGGFVIDFSPSYFGGGNYLTSGGIGVGVLGGSFGFTADLPAAANNVQLDALYQSDPRSNVTLQALNSSASIVAQQSGPAGNSNSPFSLQVSAGQFNITSIRVIAGGGASAYDNISITIAPEPTMIFLPLAAVAMLRRRR